jgi:hypothetical protein
MNQKDLFNIGQHTMFSKTSKLSGKAVSHLSAVVLFDLYAAVLSKNERMKCLYKISRARQYLQVLNSNRQIW